MVKLSKALDKAGYGNGLERKDQKDIQEAVEPQAPVELKTLSQAKKPDTAKISLSGKWDERLFKGVNEDIYLPEVFKTLRSRILHPWESDTTPRTIMVTSALPQEGKSFITANLGISLAQAVDQHSLLVDCDLRRPSLSTLFGIDHSVGLVNYLRDNVDLSELIGKTSMKKLSLLASGKPPVNPAELLGSSRMSSLVEELSRRYEDRIIIFDTPPILVAAESAVLAGQVDAVILVVRHGKSGKAQIKKIIDTIGTERLLGFVYNSHKVNYFEKTLFKGYGYYNNGYYQTEEK